MHMNVHTTNWECPEALCIAARPLGAALRLFRFLTHTASAWLLQRKFQNIKIIFRAFTQLACCMHSISLATKSQLLLGVHSHDACDVHIHIFHIIILGTHLYPWRPASAYTQPSPHDPMPAAMIFRLSMHLCEIDLYRPPSESSALES